MLRDVKTLISVHPAATVDVWRSRKAVEARSKKGRHDDGVARSGREGRRLDAAADSSQHEKQSCQEEKWYTDRLHFRHVPGW